MKFSTINSLLKLWATVFKITQKPNNLFIYKALVLKYNEISKDK